MITFWFFDSALELSRKFENKGKILLDLGIKSWLPDAKREIIYLLPETKSTFSQIVDLLLKFLFMFSKFQL